MNTTEEKAKEVAGRKNFGAAGMCYRAVGDSVGQAWGSGKKFQ